MSQGILTPPPSGAILSRHRDYRYVLWRIWDDSAPLMAVIGLNPSTADETTDDPTIRKCVKFAKSWGYGGLYMINLFAYRATSPDVMKQYTFPIGSHNDEWIVRALENCDMVLAAWGNHGNHLKRDVAVKKLIIEKGIQLKALHVNSTGQPKHPLYVRDDTEPFNYE